MGVSIMTWQHSIVIAFALIVVVACGFNHGCSEQMELVGDIAKMVIAGTLGNATGSKMVSHKREPT